MYGCSTTCYDIWTWYKTEKCVKCLLCALRSALEVKLLARAHGWCFFGGLCFFSLQEVRMKSFLWWCQPSTKNYNTADEDEQVRTVQDRTGHRWQEQ